MRRVYEFIESTPTAENHLRGIVLFGKNVASYKFALAKSIIELASAGRDSVPLEELAVPFSRNLKEHLALCPTQTTSKTSRFLDACRKSNEGLLDEASLVETTVRLGFNNVIDAFHVIGPSEIDTKFFIDERSTSTNGIRLTESIQGIASEMGPQVLAEVEARWRLVESAWDMGVAQCLIEFDEDSGFLVPSSVRRRSLTSARDSLHGYQKGMCFYCFRKVSLFGDGDDGSDVDHVFPFTLMRKGLVSNLDQIWNLVLACRDCNRGVDGKFDQTPASKFVERLARRNDYLIESNLPIKETLIRQTGSTTEQRLTFLQQMLSVSSQYLPARWDVQPRGISAF